LAGAHGPADGAPSDARKNHSDGDLSPVRRPATDRRRQAQHDVPGHELNTHARSQPMATRFETRDTASRIALCSACEKPLENRELALSPSLALDDRDRFFISSPLAIGRHRDRRRRSLIAPHEAFP
jgi:hypothetical protein